MSKYHLTICPACGFGKLKSVRWNNGLACDPDKYLDQDLYLSCGGCSYKELIFDLYFKCDSHDDFRQVNMQSLLACLSILGKRSYIPGDILRKMVAKAMDYF